MHARCRGFESRHPLVKRGCSSEVEHCPNRTNMTVAPYVGEPVAAARSPKPRPGGSTPPTSANVTVRPFGPARSGRLIVDQEIAGSSPAGVARCYRPAGSAGRARGEGEILPTGVGPDCVGYRTNPTRIHRSTGADADDTPDAALRERAGVGRLSDLYVAGSTPAASERMRSSVVEQ